MDTPQTFRELTSIMGPKICERLGVNSAGAEMNRTGN